MKTITSILSLAVIAIFYGALSTSFAQYPIVGGYKAAPVDDARVVSAANFAVKEQARKEPGLTLNSVLSAAQQVVQGMNYNLCLSINADGQKRQAAASVYMDLKGKMTLGRWNYEQCSAEADDGGEVESDTFEGFLEMGRTRSAIVYVGEETGDVAAWCFANNSEIGKRILAECGKAEKCVITGAADYAKGCKIKDQRDLSASGEIVVIDSITAIGKRKPTRRN